MFDRIRAEYDRTVEAVLHATNHANLMDSDPIIQRSIQLRNPYVDPLNYIQVDMLRRLRALPDQDEQRSRSAARSDRDDDQRHCIGAEKYGMILEVGVRRVNRPGHCKADIRFPHLPDGI